MVHFRLLTIAMCAAAASGCYVETSTADPVAVGTVADHPPSPPPPLPDPDPPPKPSADAIWLEGQYRWDGARYVWEHGHYERPPRPGALYIPGRWQERAHENVWIDAHWIQTVEVGASLRGRSVPECHILRDIQPFRVAFGRYPGRVEHFEARAATDAIGGTVNSGATAGSQLDLAASTRRLRAQKGALARTWPLTRALADLDRQNEANTKA